MLVLAFLSVFSNSIICHFILKSNTKRTVTDCFVCNLTVADIAFFMSAPLVASVRVNENWALGRGVCRLLVYSMNVCGTVMLWTMSAMSVNPVT
ncbi:hypothetical protein DPMN_166368 [Dreissena polymorpha]|uniref:G-protein coupled receptors family 1 profile domain-containing protein n=1 Tax=Dreissena polymorpha TaxID=45954 RepID=A0A9D4EZD0_DREPO|nr:hypothetical protein DPMN_166368 [Dreissena polymorpha]